MSDRYAVFGHPVAHSRSPEIHAEFARLTGQDIRYERILAPLDGFATAVAAFRAAGGRGANVTLPFKHEACALATEMTARAKAADAVNTLRFDGERVLGDNTDGAGLVRDILTFPLLENAHIALMDIDAERLRWIFDLFPAMKRFWNHPAGLLSGGQKQMLAVSRAIVEPRALILVDEPSKGLAPSIIQNMLSAFRQLKAAGVTILLVEQNFAFARQLGDSVAVMDDGRVVHAGSMAELADDEALQQRLLGLSLGAHQ